MRFDVENVYFNEEERWISGLPEYRSRVNVNSALSQVLAARDRCRESFINLLCADISQNSAVEERRAAAAYVDRLSRIDVLVGNLIPVVMPQIIGELEGDPERMHEMIEENLNNK